MLFLFLLPSLVLGDLVQNQEAAFCVFKCLPLPSPPTLTNEKTCLRLVNNVTVSESDGQLVYDRLVFEGPDCGVYTFVVRSNNNVSMTTVTSPFEKSEKPSPLAATAQQIQCVRDCGHGLLESTCATPEFFITSGSVNYDTWTSANNAGQTTYRAVQFGCDRKTTIVRVYRSEFAIRAELKQPQPNLPNTNIELWSIHKGFLRTTPYNDNGQHGSCPNQTPPAPVDKNVCALKCFNYEDSTKPVYQTDCTRTLNSVATTGKDGSWNYDREVYEGPECGVYTFVITTTGNVSMYKPDSSSIVTFSGSGGPDHTASPACLRSCGFPLCDSPVLEASAAYVYVKLPSNTATHLWARVQFECDGVKTVIVRAYRTETQIRVDLKPKTNPDDPDVLDFYSELWKISQGQLVTETL